MCHINSFYGVEMANKPNAKPSDFNEFCVVVYTASATMMEFDDFMDLYHDLLRLVFWNPDIDLPLAIQSARGG